jgi:hypothetical protein
MSKNDTVVEMLDAVLTEWCGPEKRRHLEAVMGGAATGELVEKLRSADKKQWYAVCCQHAKERAEDISWYQKPGDLFYKGGAYWWWMYWSEIRDALRAVGAGRYRQNKAYDLARSVFAETAERIRTIRIGTPEERKAKEVAGFPGIEFSETLTEACERIDRERRERERGHDRF